MENTIIIIQARIGSHRLPGKSMMPVWKEMLLLELVLSRITQAKIPTKVILATFENPKNDVLVPIAERCGVHIFRGSENDVLGRFVEAHKLYPAGTVVRAAADNPLLDPVMIDNLSNSSGIINLVIMLQIWVRFVVLLMEWVLRGYPQNHYSGLIKRQQNLSIVNMW